LRFHLNPLENKIIGELTFRSKGLLHVGSGGVEARRRFIRISDGRFLIPSSTWKGAFRSLSEKVFRSMEFKGISKIAADLYMEDRGGISYRPTDEEKRREFRLVGEDIVNALRGEAPTIIPEEPSIVEDILRELGYEDREIEVVRDKGFDAPGRLAERMTEDYLAAHCPLGRLYGNKVLAAKLRFTDSLLNIKKTYEKPGIGIDRRTGKVQEAALYFLEVAPKDLKIKLRVIADNLKPGEEDSLILASTLEIIREIGLQIGARKSVGLGELEIDEKETRFYIVDLRSDKDGVKLANPLKNVKPKRMGEFIRWLKVGYFI